jgi:hypothetical protein
MTKGEQLKTLSRSRNRRVALGATQTLLSYHAGPPQQHIAVDVTASASRQLTPQMLALLTTEELRVLYAIARRFSPEEDARLLTSPDGRDDAMDTPEPPGTPGSGPT